MASEYSRAPAPAVRVEVAKAPEKTAAARPRAPQPTRSAVQQDAAAEAARRRAIEAERKRRADEEAAAAEEQRELAAKIIADEIAAAIRKRGYLPPQPFPFVQMAVLDDLRGVVDAMVARPDADKEGCLLLAEAISTYARGFAARTGATAAFLQQTVDELRAPSSLVSRAKMFFGQIHDAIDEASISLTAPLANATLQKRMQRTELFLAEAWAESKQRGILAIHVDEEARQTILQVGMAEHGVLYVTIPRVLRPEEIAHNSLKEMMKRLETLAGTTDPLAVIDGAYQRMNFNYLFARSRVIRAPSGDTVRLAANLAELHARERLSAENTAILNSTPRSREEYLRVLPEDRAAASWSAWDGEAATWENTAAVSGFATTAEASREAFIEAVTQKQNVIVIVAHCDGKSLFMPHPEPDGTVITAEYLREHREEIRRNKPLVYLFACKAGDLKDMANFASELLDCGAAGVVASQTNLGLAEGVTLLERLLADHRGTPPLEDMWQAMRDTDFFEMEVFLA